MSWDPVWSEEVGMIDITRLGCNGGWRKYLHNPVIGGEYGECFDMCVVENEGRLRMYWSWRSRKSIAMSESDDGLEWTKPVIVLEPRSSGWEGDVNRPSVLQRDGQWHMWYSGQVKEASTAGGGPETTGVLDEDAGRSVIGYAVSNDGLTFKRSDDPVMVADVPWEGKSLMCPDVMWDDETSSYRMWYSGGGFFEPDAIGHATSGDGQIWTKSSAKPVFSPRPELLWERERTTACQVIRTEGWFVMFYIGFEDIDKARICAARSRDGLNGWERHKDNPLISGGRAGGWDCEAAYKPYVIWRDDRWIMLYNGRRAFIEQIGVAFHDDRDLGF
jgi:beta-1,2-mannobiose phosphorylase / 1,2-beta-oligomannan phosphorylase